MAEKIDLKNIPKLAELVPVDSVVDPIFKPEDYFGQQFILVDFELKDGDMGAYFLMDCIDPETQEDMQFSSGAFKIIAQLSAMEKETMLPCLITWSQSGRTHYIG